MRRRAALIALLLSLPLGAQAHLGHPVVRAERALALTLTDAPTLVYVVQLAPAESARIRREADVDHDGSVSTVEGNAQVDRWTAVMKRSVRFASGRDRYGETHSLAEARLVATESSGMVAADDDKTSVRVTWTFALPPLRDEDRLRIDDALDIVPFDHTEVKVQDTATRPLVGIGDDPNVLSVSPQLAWVDAGKPSVVRSIHIVWRAQERTMLPLFPLALAVLITASLAFVWLRARRAR